ncbi:hypothetical protein R83H12_01658 [Fibrobacteria bacterium R8-3-H12]
MLVNSKGSHINEELIPVNGIEPFESIIENFIKKNIDDWYRIRKDEWFTFRKMFGDNEKLHKTPLNKVYDKCIKDGSTHKKAEFVMGTQSGILLKNVLIDDKRKFEFKKESPNKYRHISSK